MIEVAGMKGEFEVFLYDSEGALKDYRQVKNVTVNAGFNACCILMGNSAVRPTAWDYCAIGTGTTAADTNQTTLATEVSRAQGGFSTSAVNIWKNDATFGAGTGTGNITESGMFNGNSGGTMLCRQTFGVITKGAGDTLVVTWQYTLS